MNQNRTIYGRQYELTWLSAKLFQKKNPFSVPPLVLLHGPSGCGKTTLCREVVNLHGEGSGKPPLIVFSADATLGNFGLLEFSQALIQTAETTATVLQPGVLKLKSDFKILVNQRNKERVSSTEAYNLDGSVRTVSMPDTLVAVNPGGEDLASLSVNSIHELCEQAVRENNESLLDLRLLYIFDDYSEFAPTIKRWIGGPLLEEFCKLDQFPAPGILLTSQESWEAGGQKDYWQKNPVTFFNREVPPMDHASCLEWLTDAGHSPSLIDFLMEYSEGMPERVRQLIETPGLLEEKAEQLNESKDLPQSVNARERRWLHAAAMSDFVSEDSLLLLLGENEGREALEWLETSAPIDAISVAMMGGVIHVHLRSDFREMIIKQSITKVPARHREFLEKIDLHARVVERVPVAADRDSLRALSPIQPFDSKLLQQLFGNDE